MIIGIWVLNLLISLWNSYVTGRVWVEAKHAGGGYQFMAWMGYIMASLGFSWDVFLIVGNILVSTGKITPDEINIFFQAGYILLVPGLLFSGYAIMFQSWANAYRTRSVGRTGIAAYNTYVNLHNTFNAIDDFPKAFGSVFKGFTGGRGKNKASGLILFLAILCAVSGFIIAALIVHRVAANDTEVPPRIDTKAKNGRRKIKGK
jgi:hypothetical protein